MNNKSFKIIGNKPFQELKLGFRSVIFLLLTVFTSASYGQQVMSVSDLIDAAGPLKNENVEVTRLKTLMQDNHPSAYFTEGDKNFYGGSNPVVLYVDFAQIPNISSEIKKLENVELVKVYLGANTPQMIKQEVLNKLPSLKYIYFVCDSCGNSATTNTLSSRKDFSGNLLIIHNSESQN